MNKVQSIVSQYNKSQRDDSYLKHLQKWFIENGEKYCA